MRIYGTGRCEYSSDRELNLNDCGFQVSTNEPFGVIRNKGRIDYHLLIIMRGRCTVEYEGKMYVLGENDLVCYWPYQKQRYFFLNDYSESYWVHFSGTNCQKILSVCKINSGIYHIVSTNEIYLTLKRLRKSNLEKTPVSELKCAGLLLELLCQLSEDINNDYKSHSLADDLMYSLHNNYTMPFSLCDFARENGFSTHRLIQIFKAQTGLTPHKYKLQLQLIDAKQLLKSSNMNISEISNKIGFSDPLYFSRVFKNNIGRSPSEFRKTCDENEENWNDIKND